VKVQSYLILLILGYSAFGLIVFRLLNTLHRNEAQLLDNVNRSQLVLRDVKSLESNFTHWMLLSDLVLGADESYLCDGAVKLGDKVDSLLEHLHTEVSSICQTNVRALRQFSARQIKRLHESRSLNGPNREPALNELLARMDTDSEQAIDSLEKLDQETRAVLAHNKTARAQSLSRRNFTFRILLLSFLICAVSLWLWVSSIVSHPISMLADQSRIKDNSTRNFQVKSTAPYEVQQLASALSTLVGDLEYQIQEHKKTQADRARLHHKLMDASRRAGQADVASEVLHNVGNVLNSMNVSADVIRNSLKKSLAPKLAIASQQLFEHSDDYRNYLEENERGKHFPEVLGFISGTMVDDRELHVKEIELLLKNISHVRNIIQRQLSSSPGQGVIEMFCLSELIEECISVNRPKANQIAAVVTLQCSGTLNIETDRHKLQQVLINLISNALDAIRERSPKFGEVRVVVDHDDDVEICVTDNGIGIAKENFEKIFQQGFTTKANGHGFGLHSCAMTAQVLGGNLKATSQGLGLGASFKLVIPLRKAELCKV